MGIHSVYAYVFGLVMQVFDIRIYFSSRCLGMCEYLCCGWAQWNDQKEIVTQLIITIEKCIYFRLVCTELILF